MVILVLACAEPTTEPPAPVDEVFSPSGPGPYAAATLESELTGRSGVPLKVQVWYPTSSPSGTLHAYDGLYEATAADGGPADCLGPRPVVVFSHGNGGMRFQSVFLTEVLATHGYVVVAPDHTYNTYLDLDGERLGELMLRRPEDVADAFDWLAAQATTTGGPVDGCVDPASGYALAGHSFGGYTTLATSGVALDVAASAGFCAEHDGWLCASLDEWAAAHPGESAPPLRDARTWAAVAQSPAGYEVLLGGLADHGTPTLIQGGDADTLTPWEDQMQPLYDGMTHSPRALFGLTGTGHYTFSNSCDLLPAFDDCHPPYLAPSEAHPLITESALAFLGLVRGHAELAAHVLPEDPLVFGEEAL